MVVKEVMIERWRKEIKRFWCEIRMQLLKETRVTNRTGDRGEGNYWLVEVYVEKGLTQEEFP